MHSRQTTTPPTQGAVPVGGRSSKDTTSGNDRPKPSHSPAAAAQGQEGVAQVMVEIAYSELSLAIAQVADKKDDQKPLAASQPRPHADNAAAPPASKLVEKPPMAAVQQAAAAAAAPPITFGFFDDSGVGAGSDEVSSPSPPEVSPEKTTQAEAADNIYQTSFVPTAASFIYPQVFTPYYGQPAIQWVNPSAAAPLGTPYMPAVPFSQILPPNAVRNMTSAAPVVTSQAAAATMSQMPPMYGGGLVGQAPAQQEKPRRERHVLAIIDPNTNKNLLKTPNPEQETQCTKPSVQYEHAQLSHGAPIKKCETNVRNALIEKVPRSDLQAELLEKLKLQKAENAWFYDYREGNRVYASDYMLLLVKVPLSCQKPQFSNNLHDVTMEDWDNRAEQTIRKRGTSVGHSSTTGGSAPFRGFQVNWHGQQVAASLLRPRRGYSGRGLRAGIAVSKGHRGPQDSSRNSSLNEDRQPGNSITDSSSHEFVYGVYRRSQQQALKHFAMELFAEYSSYAEYSEAKELVLAQKSHFSEMIAYIIESIIEKNDDERSKFSELMSKLYKDFVIDKPILTDGVAKFVKLCVNGDLVHVHLIWNYLAAIIVEILKLASLSLVDFRSSFIAACDHNYTLFMECLKKLSQLPKDQHKSAYGDFFTFAANSCSLFGFEDQTALICDLETQGISIPAFVSCAVSSKNAQMEATDAPKK